MTTGTIQLAFLITSLVPLNSNFTSWTNFSKIQLSWLWFSKILMPLPRKWQALFVLVHSNFSSFSRPYLLYYLSYSSFYWTPFALCWLGFEFARINRSRATNSVIDLVDHPFPLTLLIFSKSPSNSYFIESILEKISDINKIYKTKVYFSIQIIPQRINLAYVISLYTL